MADSSQPSSQSSQASNSKLPTSFRKKAQTSSDSDIQDQQGFTTLGIHEILQRDFGTSSAASEASMSSGEGRKGYDLSWYLENKFRLFVHIEMDPLDIYAPSDAFAFAKDTIEMQVQQAIELELEKLSSFNKCFIKVKPVGNKAGFKFMMIPIKIIMTLDDRGTTREIVLEACPPQVADGPSKDDMRSSLLKVTAKFPVIYRDSYKRRDNVQRWWCCSIKEESMLDDELVLSIEFQIQYHEDKVDKDTQLAWNIIHKWILQAMEIDLSEKALFEVKLIAGFHRIGQTQHRAIHPKFLIVYNAPDLQSLERMCFVVGIRHGQTIRLGPKEAPGCAEGFEFRFYCTLFDSKILASRPTTLKPTIQRVHDHLSPQVTPESLLRLYVQKHLPSKCFSVDDLRKAPELQMISAKLRETILLLIENNFLSQRHDHQDILSISPLRRPWIDFSLLLPDQSSFAVQHKDCGIWIDRSLGLPAGQQPVAFRCFIIHVALSYSAMSRTDVSPWELEQFMQFRFNQFLHVLNSLKENQEALSIMNLKYQTSFDQANKEEIDPDFVANPAFWLNYSRLEELASCAASESFVSMWAFLFLPLEFLQYNYVVVNTRPVGEEDTVSSAKVVGGSFHFISDKAKAGTIFIRFAGGEDGHFSSLLFRQKADDFKKKLMASGHITQIKFKKNKSALWDAIADAFLDVSIEAFQSKSHPQLQLNLPSARQGNDVGGLDDKGADLNEGEARPKGQDESTPKVPKKIEDLKRIVASVFDACYRADELSDTAFDTLTASDLNAHTKEFNGFLSSCRSAIARLPKFDDQDSQCFPELFAQFRSLSSMIANVTCIRDSCQRLYEEKTASGKKTPAKGGKSKDGQAAKLIQPLDLFCKVRSSLPVDDISDAITDGQLLGLFVIHPTPTFIASFYFSILHSSTNHQIIEEMEARFKRKLSISKAAASELCQATRRQFDSVKANQMVRGGKTFEEYLAYKGVKSWDKIAYDNVLGELSLCSQVWKLNIALIWRHDNVWRLFVATNGGSSPILTVVYAKTAVSVNASGTASFTSGTAGRFFPIDPINPDGEEWYNNDVFKSQIPDSAPVEVFDAVATFQRHIHREHPFQSVVDVEGYYGSDTSSEITAEASQSELFNSFIDNSSVSQGSLPTPQSIRDIPLPVIVAAVNQSMVLALEAVKGKKRVVSPETQEEDDAQFAEKNGAAKAGSAALGE
jgi:hypothetical protein